MAATKIRYGQFVWQPYGSRIAAVWRPYEFHIKFCHKVDVPIMAHLRSLITKHFCVRPKILKFGIEKVKSILCWKMNFILKIIIGIGRKIKYKTRTRNFLGAFPFHGQQALNSAFLLNPHNNSSQNFEGMFLISTLSKKACYEDIFMGRSCRIRVRHNMDTLKKN
jgi:hypothetical protein